MSILFLTRLYYPHVGGVEKHVEKISKLLKEKGHTVTIITELFDSSLPQYDRVNGIDIYRMPVGNNEKLKKFYIWHWLLIHQELFHAADIIHAHDVFFWYLPFRFLFPKKPVFTTFHGYEGYPIRKNAVRIRKIAEKHSKGNISIGKFMGKWYGTKATYVSYGAVDIDDRGKKVSGKNSAVFVGRLDDQTGILTYTDAVEKLRKNIPDFSLDVFGDGPLKNRMPSFIKRKGFKKEAGEEIGKYHFAFVSRYLTILEALASKRLVFAAYDNPVKEDYLRMTPFADFIIIIRTASELAEKVDYFLKHPDAERKLIDAGYQWVKTQTWEVLSDLYLSLWQSVRAK